MFKIAVDSGGTFTDGVLMDEKGKAILAKAHTTPADPTIGTLNCISLLAENVGTPLAELLAQTSTIIHGTTHATNVVATKSGAKMGTITTKGFRTRIAFPHVSKVSWKENPLDMYDYRSEAPKPLTPLYLMTEVAERIDKNGEIVTPLDEEDVRRALRYLKGKEVESIAVNLMFSQLNPSHEQRIAEIIKHEYPEVYVALSSTVLPVIGETERWSTTMFSAYVAPAVTHYVEKIERLLQEKGFKGELLFIQSNGGVAAPQIIVENPATMLLSGPAAGPSLALALGRMHGEENVLSVDMGGTSFDVGVVYGGTVEVLEQQYIDAKAFALPSVDVTAVGAGGGSIAKVDISGRLQVGPQSAGSYPGPACYDHGGTEPTVTDANVVLGYIDPDFFLGGAAKLRKDLAEKVILEKIAEPLGLGVPEAAAAIYDVINSTMASGTDVSFARRGYDPRDFVVSAAGGAAAVHAVRIAQELGVKKLIVPKVGPTFCAYGMMFCDLKHDYQRTYSVQTVNADLSRINELYAEMEALAIETLQREGVASEDVVFERGMKVRYYGQFRDRLAVVPRSGEITKQLLEETIENFHQVHANTVGYSDANYPTEIQTLLFTGRAITTKPTLESANALLGPVSEAKKGTRQAYFRGQGFIETSVYDGDLIASGSDIKGPAIIEEKFTTFVLPPGSTARVDKGGNYVVEIKEEG